MTFNFLGPGLTVNVEAKVKEQIILDSSGINQFSIVGLGAGTSSPSSHAKGRIAINAKKMRATATTSHFHNFFFSFCSIDSPKVILCGYFRLIKADF